MLIKNLWLHLVIMLVACGVALKPATAADPGVDLRVLVDISAEMASAQPDKAYLDALKLLLQRLPDDSAVGIWTFGKYTNYLVPHQPINTAWRQLAADKINTVPAVASYRDIGLVLRKASYDRTSGNSMTPRHLLLLSAGEVLVSEKPEENDAARTEIINRWLPRLRDAGYIIHSIALNNANDKRLLSILAKETGGFSFSLSSPQQIYPALMRLAQLLAPRNNLPIEDGQFAVERAEGALDLFIRHAPGEPAEIIRPTGELLTATDHSVIHWVGGNAYTFIRIKEPETGPWRLTGRVLPQSQILTENAPQLNVSGLASHYFAGENLQLQAYLKGDAGDEAVRISLNLYGKTEHSYELIEDSTAPGTFTVEANGFQTPGIYQAELVAQAPNFTRVLERPFQVHELLATEVSKQTQDNTASYLIEVQPLDPELDIETSTIVATITDSSGEWRVSSVAPNDAGHWVLPIEEGGHHGELEVKLDFQGTTVTGRQLHFQPKPLVIQLPPPQPAPTKLIIPEPKQVALNDKAAPDTARKSARDRPVLLIVIALICGLGALLLLLFYFVRRRNPPTPPMATTAASDDKKQDTDQAPQQTKPATSRQGHAAAVETTAMQQQPAKKSLMDEPIANPATTNGQQSPDAITNNISGNQRTEDKRPKIDQPMFDTDIEIIIDDAVDKKEDEEGTELAAAWRELAAESTEQQPTDAKQTQQHAADGTAGFTEHSAEKPDSGRDTDPQR